MIGVKTLTKADRQMVRMADIPAWQAVEANDMVRIDHFRVLDTYFSISYGDMNAKRGGAVGFSWAVMRALWPRRPIPGFSPCRICWACLQRRVCIGLQTVGATGAGVCGQAVQTTGWPRIFEPVPRITNALNHGEIHEKVT